MNQQPSEKSIFLEAIEQSSASGRGSYLDAVCGDNPKLREEVEVLLRAHDRADDLLDMPDTLRQESAHGITEGPGSTVGRYKLLEQIGEGGMGVVYMAQQVEPLQRKVALKIIKPGMDTKQVIARFEAERQALALMDHPNIAHVLDAGATDSGRPYFVMELVRGIPITEYSDETKLDTSGRLNLFLSVCRAVHHAHQKGIIHRDIKPSNVLVTLHDGVPVPKIIDFGVAKATNQQLTDRTLFTRFSEMIGTPLYMSPEQAEMSGLDIDTRTDVFSLGVLLYELLTGTTPFDKQTLRRAGYDEMRRIIREDDPPIPSARVSTLGAQLRTVSDRRGTDPRRLRESLRGELDWIVMKSIEKDRNRRYESTSAFAEDVERYLKDEPVQACPPSRAYRLQKFICRNRRCVIAATVLAISLIAGFAGTTVGLIRSWKAQAELKGVVAKLEETNDKLSRTQNRLLTALKEETLNAAMSGDYADTVRMIEEARAAEAPESWETLMRGLVALYGGESQLAIDTLSQATDQDPDSVAAWSMLANAYLYAGHFEGYEKCMLELGERKSESLDDMLFHAQVELDKQKAIEIINRVLEQRPRWGFALALRGQAKAQLAIDSGQAKHAEDAIADIERARVLLGDNPFVLAAALFSYQVVIQFTERNGTGSTAHRSAAADIARELDRFPRYGLGRVNSAWYFDAGGNVNAAEQQWQAAVNSGASDLFRSSYAAFLFRQSEADQALAMLNEEPEPRGAQTEIARAFCLLDTQDGQAAAKGIFAELRRRKLPPMSQILTLTIPMLVGDKESVAQASHELLARDMPQWAAEGTVEFLAGDISPDTLIERAGSSNNQRCIALWLIGVRCLGDGDRDGAKRYLTDCVDTGYFYTAICHWAKAFLARMERDPDWPNVKGK